MPSDAALGEQAALGELAMTGLAPRLATFHEAVATAAEEIRRYVTEHSGGSGLKREQALVELGPFALGRIDPARFAGLLGDADELSSAALAVLDRARVLADADKAQVAAAAVAPSARSSSPASTSATPATARAPSPAPSAAASW